MWYVGSRLLLEVLMGGVGENLSPCHHHGLMVYLVSSVLQNWIGSGRRAFLTPIMLSSPRLMEMLPLCGDHCAFSLWFSACGLSLYDAVGALVQFLGA